MNAGSGQTRITTGAPVATCSSRPILYLACIGLVFAVTGCATNTNTPLLAPGQDWTPPTSPTVLIVPPDVTQALLTTGELEEVRVDWTEKARANLNSALEDVLGTRGIATVPYDVVEGSVAWNAEDAPIIKLHKAVGLAIRSASILPTQATKRPYLDYSLGPAVSRLKETYGADYALFVHTKTTHASGGRIAVSLLAALGDVNVPWGKSVMFASLVDHTDGSVIWVRDPFVSDTLGTADLRERKEASSAVEVLLEGFPL